VADPEIEHQIENAQETAQPDGLEQEGDEPPDLAVKHLVPGKAQVQADAPVHDEDEQPHRQLADHQGVDKVGDAVTAPAAFEIIDPIHGSGPPNICRGYTSAL